MKKDFNFKSIELINFMSFPYLKENFSEDITVVVGPNGTGKSAILTALSVTFAVKGKTLATSNYIRKTDKGLCEKAVIKLEASYKSEPLTILTELYSNPNAPRRIHKVVDFQGTHLEDVKATKYLESLFGRETMVSFALQGNEKFLTSSKSQNLMKFMNLLKLDFEKEITYARNNNRLESAKVSKAETDKAVLENSIKSLQETQAQLQSQLESTEALLKSGSIDPSEIETLNIKIEELTKSKAEIKIQIENKQRNFEILNQLELKLNQVTNQIAQEEKNLEILGQGLEVPKKDISKIEEDILEESKLVKDSEETLQSINEKIISQNNKITEVRTKLKAEEEHLKKLEGSTCPLCTQDIPSSLKLSWNSNIESLKKEELESIENLQNISKEVETIKIEINSHREKVNSLNKEKTDAIRFNSELDLKKSKYEACKANIEHLKETKATTEESFKNLPSGTVSEDFLEKKFKELEADYELSSKERTIKQSQLQDFRTNQVLNQKAKGELEDVKSKETDTQLKLQETFKEWEDSRKASEAWQSVQDLFKVLPRLHLKRFVKNLEAYISQTVKVFDYPGAKVYYDEEKSELGFSLLKEDFQVDYELCSSFEKILLNLSVIYALTKLFDLPFICIDELDSSADKKNTKILGTLIIEIAKKVTVVTVSHDEGLTSSLLSSSESSSIISTIKGES